MAETVTKRTFEGFASSILFQKVFDVFYLCVCMSMSGALTGNTLFGGAIYLAGQILSVYLRLYGKREKTLLPLSIQARGIFLVVTSGLLMAALLFLYPFMTEHPHFNLLLQCIALLFLRQSVTDMIGVHLKKRRRFRALLLFAAYVVFNAPILLLIRPAITQSDFDGLASMLLATGFAAFAYQTLSLPQKPPPKSPDVEKLNDVSAYRVYNRMVSSIAISMNLALVTYICTAELDVSAPIGAQFWNLVVWMLLVGGIAACFFVFFKRRLTYLDKPSVFVLGAAMLSLSIIGTNSGWFLGFGMLPGYLLLGGGLACILSILLAMSSDMQAVLELFMTREEYEGYLENTRAVIEWALTFSMHLVLFMLTFLAFMNEGTEALKNMPFARFMLDTMNTWPLLFALMQPLNKDYAHKLERYRALQKQGKANPALETRLKLMLAKRTRRIFPAILLFIVRFFFPCKVIGKERVDTKNGPVVFVCNHLEIYGPVITNLHLPFYFRSWIVSGMLDKDSVSRQLESGVATVFHRLPMRIQKKIPQILTPVAVYILNALDPIPVYKNSMRALIKTMQLTVDAMEYEDNILLFPENPADGQYKSKGVSRFYSGFARIGTEYYKRTGQCTTFYPMYANKQKRTLTIGEGIRYRADRENKQEQARIVDTLHAWMEEQNDEM